MAYAYDEAQKGTQVQGDEDKQDQTVLTSTQGDIGAEPINASTSGASVKTDKGPNFQQNANQVISRNRSKATNPFNFAQTTQALQGAKTGIQSEKDTYMANAAAPYQFNAATQGAVQNWARSNTNDRPDWLNTFNQGMPQAPQAFNLQTNTNFAPIEAMKTNAGVRNYLRNPADPESRSGEQSLDFSLLNTDPNFNLQREAALRDYSGLMNLRNQVEQETPQAARAAQLAAFQNYKNQIAGTLGTEGKAIEDAARAQEAAYDAKYADLLKQKGQVANEAAAEIAGKAPEALRGYVRGIDGEDLNAFFKPKDASSTAYEDFLSGDQAANWNKIMAALGAGGKVLAPGRLAGKTAPGVEDLGFDKAAYRDVLLNKAQADMTRAMTSPFANTNAYAPVSYIPPEPPTYTGPVAQPGQLAIETGENAYAPLLPEGPADQYVYNDWNPAMAGQLAIQLSKGGRVPGIAPAMGDTPKNDVVKAKLSPGEIVIPRSMAGSKDAAKAFIDNMPWSKTRDLLKTKYNCGGMVEENYACGGKVMPKKKGYK